MELLQTYWPHIALVIVVAFFVAVTFIRRKGEKDNNDTLKKFADGMTSIMRSVSDKDAVLRQTFRNVEELKKKLQPLIDGGELPKVGEFFKGLNEEVGMEDLIRDHYIDSIGPEIGLKKNDDGDTVFIEVPEPEE